MMNNPFTFEERAAELVSRMTLEEKASQLSNYPPAIPRLGVKRYNYWNEGLHGVANTVKSLGQVATSFPYSIAMASSWDPELIKAIASASGDEARAYTNKGIRDLSYWCPTINMSRDPRWGRNHESYGEDNHLTTELAKKFIDGYQGNGDGVPYLKVISCLKHYAANNSEYNRENGSSSVQNPFIRDYFTRSFKDVIRSTHLRSVMSAYNMVNDVPSSGSHYLLDTLLRKTFGFDGYVVSDCGAIRIISSVTNHHWNPKQRGLSGYEKYEDGEGYVTRTGSTALCLDAGCDMDCGDVFPQTAKEAVEKGLLSEETVDRALVRIFTARMETGEFDAPADVPYCSEEYSWDNKVECPAHITLAEDSSTQTIVLLKNDAPTGETAPILPLDAAKCQKVVMVGPLVDKAELGGYSGTPSDERMSTPRQGVERFVDAANITYVSGKSTGSAYMCNLESLTIEKLDGSKVVLTPADVTAYTGCETDGSCFRFVQPEAVLEFRDVCIKDACKVTTRIAGGEQTLLGHIEVHYGNAGGGMLADIDTKHTGGSLQFEDVSGFNANGGYDRRDLFVVFASDESPVSFTSEEEQAIREADVVIACMGGINSSEGSDRVNIALWNNQHELVRAVATLNPRTVCHLQTVGVMEIESFKDLTPAISWTCNNGQAQGNALGRVLFGDVNPSAKLPFTWYSYNSELETIDDYDLVRPDYKCGGWTYQYFTGHVTYPFGHGVNYSTFEYANLRMSDHAVTPDTAVTVWVDVTNTSGVDGREVVQLYVKSPCADGVKRPFKQLKAFQKIDLAAGETKTVELTLPMSECYFWDEEGQHNVWDKGEYTIFVGPSSDEGRCLTEVITLSGERSRTILSVNAIPDRVLLNAAKPDTKTATRLSVAMEDDSLLDGQAEELTVTYTTNRPEAATVDEAGVVTPIGKGVVTVTATVQLGEQVMTASYALSVEEELTLDRLLVDGEELSGFSPDKTEYYLPVSGDAVPTVTGDAGGAAIKVAPAKAVPGDTVVTLTRGTQQTVYTLHFLKRSRDYVAATFGAINAVYEPSEAFGRQLYAGWATADGVTEESGINLYAHEFGDLHFRATLTIDKPEDSIPDAAVVDGACVKLRSVDENGENHYGWTFEEVGITLHSGVNYIDIPLTAKGRHVWGWMDWSRLNRILFILPATEKLAGTTRLTVADARVVDVSLGWVRDALWAKLFKKADTALFTPASAEVYDKAYERALTLALDDTADENQLADGLVEVQAAVEGLEPMTYAVKRFPNFARSYESFSEGFDGSLKNNWMWGNWSKHDAIPLDVSDKAKFRLQMTLKIATKGGIIPPAEAWEKIEIKVRSAMMSQKPGDEDPTNKEHNICWILTPDMVGATTPDGIEVAGRGDYLKISIPLDAAITNKRGIFDWSDLRELLTITHLVEAIRDERPVQKEHNYTMTIADPKVVDVTYLNEQKAILAALPGAAGDEEARTLLATDLATPAEVFNAIRRLK